MAKVKKKRNKVYRGASAAHSQPSVTRIAAVNRSKPAQWLYDRRQLARPALIATVTLFVLILLIIGIAELLH
jgi:hypothetical protein